MNISCTCVLKCSWQDVLLYYKQRGKSSIEEDGIDGELKGEIRLSNARWTWTGDREFVITQHRGRDHKGPLQRHFELRAPSKEEAEDWYERYSKCHSTSEATAMLFNSIPKEDMQETSCRFEEACAEEENICTNAVSHHHTRYLVLQHQVRENGRYTWQDCLVDGQPLTSPVDVHSLPPGEYQLRP